MNEAVLKIYLDDHLVGANAVTEMVRRRLDRGDGPMWLNVFLSQLEEEAAVLRDLADEVGRASAPKQAVGWMAEKVAQLKLMADGHADESLRDLLELEAMRTGVEGKRCLVRSLRQVKDDPRLSGMDLESWEQQVDEQATQLERFRLDAARDALTG